MSQIDIKENLLGGLNLDDSNFVLPNNAYADALNITLDALEGNNDRIITNIIGNRKIDYSYPGGTAKVIGLYPFQLRNTVIIFRWNENGYNGIYEYNNTTRTISKIFESITDSGGIDILNFTENSKITQINIYPRTEGDLLYFLDSLGRPTQIDISLFKAGEYTPVTRDIIDKAKNPPLSPPQVVFANDTSVRSNNFRKRLTRYYYRWIYDDLEKSVSSPISIVPLQINIFDDTYTNVVTNNNVVNMVLNTGGKNVKSIEIGMSLVDGTNNWSDFGSIAVVEKSSLGLMEEDFYFSNTFDGWIGFSGTVITGVVINVYATLLPNTKVLLGTYTTVLGDTPTTIASALVVSMTSIGVARYMESIGAYLIYGVPIDTYEFNSIELLNNNVADNADFPYAFYNDSAYPTILITESLELFDYVPPIAKAQGMPNGNYLVYGNITEGYDKNTIKSSIITVDTVAAGNGGSTGSLNAVRTQTQNISSEIVDKFQFSGIPAVGTVIEIKVKRKSDHTVIVATTYTTVSGDTIYTIEVALYNNLTAPDIVIGYGYGGDALTIQTATYEAFDGVYYASCTITPPSNPLASNSMATWKWSTSRNIGRVYFDQKGVTNGVLYTDKVTFPAYAENGSGVPLLPFINYKINDVPPDWAYSMVFVFTKENTQWVEWQTSSVVVPTEAYLYFKVTFDINAVKNPTTAAVLNYTFKDGDRMRILKDVTTRTVLDDTYDAAILGLVTDPSIDGATVTGTFIKINKVAPFTSVIVNTDNYVIELYTPAQQLANANNQVYYECGRQYYILDPTLPTRRHRGEVTDQVVGVTPAEYNFYEGDAYFRVRNIYTESGVATFDVMDRNFVDFYISAVSSVDGRPNIIDINAKRQTFGSLIRFSEAYQADTNINGLNRFYSLNYIEGNYGYGGITAFSSRANWLKVFHQFRIGDSPIFNELSKDSNNNSILVRTDKLLNQIRYRIGIFGLSSPESLASWHFADYGADTSKGVIWRDSNDGVQPISQLYKIDSWATIELPLRTGDIKIYGVIDPKKNQYIAALEAYNGIMPNSPAQTISFSEGSNSFESFLSYNPEMMCALGNLLITAKDGDIYTHDSPVYNNFYGVQYNSWVTPVFNNQGPVKKKYLATGHKSLNNVVWESPTNGDITTSTINPQTGLPQISQLAEGDYEEEETTLTAGFLYDANSGADAGEALVNGDFLGGNYLKMKFACPAASCGVLVNLQEPYITWIVSQRNF